MLREDERSDAGDVRSREAVARADEAPPARPRYLDVDAAREELDRGRRVVVVRVRIRLLVAADGDDAREADAMSMVRRKYALSASSCRSDANFCFVVERLMLMTS